MQPHVEVTAPLDKPALAAKAALLARKASLQRSAPSAEVSAELAELDAALGRIEAGTWGRCERCESAIGRTRLRSMPEVRLCVECANLAS